MQAVSADSYVNGYRFVIGKLVYLPELEYMDKPGTKPMLRTLAR